jgi:hypothetical protein
VIRSPWLARTLYAVGREGDVIPRVTLAATGAVYSAILAVVEEGRRFDANIELQDGPPAPRDASHGNPSPPRESSS